MADLLALKLLALSTSVAVFLGQQLEPGTLWDVLSDAGTGTVVAIVGYLLLTDRIVSRRSAELFAERAADRAIDRALREYGHGRGDGAGQAER